MRDLAFFETDNFKLQMGAILPRARLVYRTLGVINEARDNAILLTSGFAATADFTERVFVGKDRPLNPGKFFIILPNMFGSGATSSPSNTPEPFEKARFPLITVHDNVRLQQMMVQQQLGIERLRLVAGWSMGAAQAFEWGAQFPDMVDAVCPIAGAARAAAYNKIFLYSLERVLKLDPAFREGYYTIPPVSGLKAFATIYAGWGFSEAAYRTELYRDFGARDYKEWVEMFWEGNFLHCDANNLLSQLWTWVHADISANEKYKGDFEGALAAIKARAIILSVDQDRYFPPVDALHEARHMPNAECRIINSIWGHYMPGNLSEKEPIDRAFCELLES